MALIKSSVHFFAKWYCISRNRKPNLHLGAQMLILKVTIVLILKRKSDGIDQLGVLTKIWLKKVGVEHDKYKFWNSSLGLALEQML